MAQEEKATPDTSSIEAVLKSLSSRPNVQFTLILSRKDGSIIKSTGFKETQVVSRVAPQDYTDKTVESKGSGDTVDLDGTVTSEDTSQTPASSPAERLASSIYSFMKVADVLASDVYSPELSSDLFNPSNPTNAARGQKEIAERNNGEWDADIDVQLLRMRTNRQEVIIFPDTNYLCCVVQNTSRGGNVEGSR